MARERAAGPVGFALAEPFPKSLHLEELDVLPAHGRRGLGTALIRAVLEAASRLGWDEVTLCTFDAVPWNAPFYERLGFEGVSPDQQSPELRARVEAEERDGLPSELRVVMACPVRVGPG